MNVYDFDKTIYDGDSSADFCLFCIRKKTSLLKFFPKQLSGCIKYAFGKADLKQLKESFFSFLYGIDNVSELVKEFWDKHENRIKKWYMKEDDDVIISASPEFLLAEICERLGIKLLIATKMDEKTGKISGENCKGEEKVTRLYKEIGNAEIDNFYSDSLSDSPLASIAKNAYLVKKEKITEWPSKAKENPVTHMEILLYLFFGILTVIIDISVYELLYLAGAGNLLSTVISWFTAVLFAFFTNKNYVFNSKKTNSTCKEMMLFFLGRTFTGIFQVIFMVITVDMLTLNHTICKSVSTVIVVLANYFISKFLIF